MREEQTTKQRRGTKDLTGQRFGRWVVVGRAENSKNRNAKWWCKCDCGIERAVLGNSLVRGLSKSCGCYASQRTTALHPRNRYDLTGEYGKGYTCNTNAEFLFDLEDFDKIKDIRWAEWKNGNRYNGVRGYDKRVKDYVKMSWVVFEKGSDHINHNPLDNRKSNLRSATVSENASNRGHQANNRCGVIGVGATTTWNARIRKDGVLYSKRFNSFEDAVKQRLLWEKEFFGEYAPQKHLYEEYGITED